MKYFTGQTGRFSVNPQAAWEEISGKGDGVDGSHA